MSLYRDAVRALVRAIVGEIPEPPATYAVVIPAYVRGPDAPFPDPSFERPNALLTLEVAASHESEALGKVERAITSALKKPRRRR